MRPGCGAQTGDGPGRSELAVTGGLTNAGEALFVPSGEAVAQPPAGLPVEKAELIPSIGAALLALELSGQPLARGWTLLRQKQSVKALGMVEE